MAAKKTKDKNIAVADMGEPNSEPQWKFFTSTAKYTCYGGARGGGKSWAIQRKAPLGAYSYPGIRILILRREYGDMENSIIAPMLKILAPGSFTYNKSDHLITFVNGSTIKFGNMPGYHVCHQGGILVIITDMYYGRQSIVAAYLGRELIWQKGATIRSKLDMQLDLQGNVISVLAVPVSAETQLDIGMEAAVMIRPVAPACPDIGFSLAIEPESTDTPEAARMPPARDGITIGIEAEVYVYNKAETMLDGGVEIEVAPQATAGVAAPVGLFENLSIDLEAGAQAPTAAPLSYEGNAIKLTVDGGVSTPESCSLTAEPEPLKLNVEAEMQTPDVCMIAALAGIQLGIEAIVTVLPAAAIAAELAVELGSEAELFPEVQDWIYPVQTDGIVYIRQVCNIVQEES